MPVVYIVDDQPAVCRALRELLSVLGYEVETFGSAIDFLSTWNDRRQGCLVADVRMPKMDGIELMRELNRRSISLPVILMSGHADVPMAVAAIKAGAADFIEKPVDDSALVSAINRCFAQAFEDQAGRHASGELERRFQLLTPRETEVFDLVAQGYTSNAIAMLLGISARTVESYRMQVMTKMNAESVAVIVRQAIKLGRMQP